MRKSTFGYLADPSNTCLVVKLKHLPVAEAGVTITVQDHRYLGAVLGSRSFVDKLEKNKVTSWTLKIWSFSDNTKVYPQAAMQLLLMAWHFAQERGQTTIDGRAQSNVLYLRVAIQHSDLYAEVINHLTIISARLGLHLFTGLWLRHGKYWMLPRV